MIWRFAIWYWVLSVTATEPLSSFAAIPSGKQLERKEKNEMKGTRHNGRSEKMEFTIRFIMIADLIWNTVSISTMKESRKIFTGTAIMDIPKWKIREKRIIFLFLR